MYTDNVAPVMVHPQQVHYNTDDDDNDDDDDAMHVPLTARLAGYEYAIPALFCATHSYFPSSD